MQGLDYVVWRARESGMRVVLTLTNYQPAFGGALQWVQWLGGSSITDFYTSPTIRCLCIAHPALLCTLHCADRVCPCTDAGGAHTDKVLFFAVRSGTACLAQLAWVL